MASEIREHRNGGLQERARAAKSWTKENRATFLDVLAVTANISRAAAAVGLSSTSVHRLRRRDAEFAALWAEAITQGYDRVEERLIEHALAGAPVNAIDPATLGEGPAAAAAVAADAARAFDTSLALQIVKIGRLKQAGVTMKRGGGTPLRATQAELVEAIDKRLTLLAKRNARRKRARLAAARVQRPADETGSDRA